MKRMITILMAATVLTASMPAFASAHGDSHDPADLQCAKDCELMLKNCSQDVDTIQQKIERLKTAIRKQGAEEKTVADVKALQQKLVEAKALLRDLEKGGH